VLKDFASYAEGHEKIGQLYKDAQKWREMAIINVAKSGKFSSDRTIQQYSDEIWKLKQVNISI